MEPLTGMIDLRSDTVTLPTEEMLESMRHAALGDDGLDGDPTVRALEEEAAGLFGKESGLFVASGTMGNLVASLVYAEQSRGIALVDQGAHIARSEGDGITRLAGLSCARLPTEGAQMDLDAVRSALVGASPSRPVAMAVVETTHNFSGGRIPSIQYMQALCSLAGEAGVPVHIDGARVFNAAVSLGVDVSTIAGYGDSLTFCLSKGLSAPMGSVLVGTRDFISRARGFRRMVGGGLRQAGVAAAAGRMALGHMVQRLAEDHRRAGLLWRKIKEAAPDLVDEQPPASNIVMLGLHPEKPGIDARRGIERLAARGLLARARDDEVIRLVTHRHIDESAVQRAAGILISCPLR